MVKPWRRRVAALKAAGCTKPNIFFEKISGVVTDRKALAKAIPALGEGDTLVVTRVDRLADQPEIYSTRFIPSPAKVMASSRWPMFGPIRLRRTRLMLTVLGGLAELERELIRARTGEGRVRAKARGVHMGRPSKLTPHQQREALERRENGETLVDIARTFNVSHATISRLSP
jgi:DNA invertase Pin-like site-specific DNA recombinase